jgi:hypothetical protein
MRWLLFLHFQVQQKERHILKIEAFSMPVRVRDRQNQVVK